MLPYIPTKEDTQWCKSILLMLKDGGNWICSYGIARVSHTDKTLIFSDIVIEDPEEREVFIHRTEAVFGKEGYSVFPPESNLTDPD